MKSKILAILLFLFLYPFTLYAEDRDSIIFAGIDYIHQDKFDEGIAEFKKLIQLNPDDAGGYMYVAASLVSIIDDYRNPSYRWEFEKYINLAIQKGEERMNKGNCTAEDLLYLGGSYGYRGIYRSFNGDWWGAFWDGGKAKKFLEKGIETDSTYYDIYFGLGAYNFYRSIKSKMLWWLPFFGDKRKLGIEQTKLAIQKGKVTRDEAEYGLLRIYVENQQYDSALALGPDLKKIKPDDPFLLWFLGQAQIKKGMYKDALESYQTLLKTFEAFKYSTPRGMVETRYWIAYLYQVMGDKANCLEQIDQILKYQAQGESDDYIKEFIQKALDIKKSIRQHNQP
ncbi:MAG: hypothetical protein MUO85_11020 [candidate division Zixibacteria bacterium]|nr:hypothetical protein [candidate division Zixibacteria bacterium]